MHLTLELVALLAAVAFVAGAIDALAGGGGLLTLPTLLAVGVPPVSAVATNKLQSTCGTGSAVFAFWRKGHIDARRFAATAAAVFVGAALGSLALQKVDPAFLAGFMPALLVAMAIYFLVSPRFGDVERHQRIGGAALALLLAAIGFYDGIFGPGAGSFYTTALVTMGGLGLVRAIAHTKLFNFTSNVASLIVMALGGKVLWLAGFAMAAGSVLGAQAGAHIAMRWGGRGVRPLLVVMSLALTARLLANPANPLRLWLGI
ncbi:MAG: TSUP family transporter [Sphingomonas fennica]